MEHLDGKSGRGGAPKNAGRKLTRNRKGILAAFTKKKVQEEMTLSLQLLGFPSFLFPSRHATLRMKRSQDAARQAVALQTFADTRSRIPAQRSSVRKGRHLATQI